ncbi:hypothetical protein [Pseudomonas sp. JDS28PS106]|uniref:hypothetical protein n=1 Tax=Pseudomonas sp. JDS28PS106 TaxID=2497235 RepID=UPI002FD2D086
MTMISETEGNEEKGPNRVPFINDPAKPANPEQIREQAEDDEEMPDDSYRDA